MNKRHFLSDFCELRHYLLLLLTQTVSQLGSAMTSFALVIWLYQQTGSALSMALLTVCSYAPYVALSMLGGALCDKWNKRDVMLVCDALSALCTVCVLLLLKAGRLEHWHLYVINACSGLMNTVQQPASEVAVTLLLPRRHYQRMSALRSMTGSLVGLLTPVLAVAVLTLAGMEAVILIDLASFLAAFAALLLFIRVPDAPRRETGSLRDSVRSGLRFLRAHDGVRWIILYLAAINFIASMYDAALPALVLSRPYGGETALGLVNTFVSLGTLAGGLVTMALRAPRDRVRMVHLTLLVSMCTENFMLALGRAPWIWCAGAFLGWVSIPLMNANLDVIMRSSVPTDMQGRVYACRNSLQFFSIPLGNLLGGALVDGVFEPLMARQGAQSLLVRVFGAGKGSGAALLFLLIGVSGVAVCLLFGRVRALRALGAQVALAERAGG